MSISTVQSPGAQFAPPNGIMPAPPRAGGRRRRSPVMASLGVLLVVLGALGGWRYVAASSTATDAYIAVYQAVPVGAEITSDDLQTVQITTARGLTPIPASDASRVIGQYAKVALVPGTLLTDGDLMPTNAIGTDQALVGLQLTATQRPGRTLKPGDQVLLIEVPPVTGVSSVADTSTMPTTPATVVEVGDPDNNNNAVVDVVIPVADAGVVASFANQSRVSVALVAGG